MFTMFNVLSRASFTDSSDDEDLDDIESMYEGQAQSILSSIDESIGKIDDFLAFDKCYVHGDIVFSVMDPSAQLGKVIDIDVIVDLENDHGKMVKDINSKELLRIRSFCTGDYVIHGPWLGVVDRVKELVTIVFDDVHGLVPIVKFGIRQAQPFFKFCYPSRHWYLMLNHTSMKHAMNFEALVEEHFRTHAQSILAACKDYIEGAQDGCVSEDGKIIGGDCGSSAGFKLMLAKIFPKLVSAFGEKLIECGVLSMWKAKNFNQAF